MVSGMARTTVITDDLDGTPNAETVTFSLEGRMFQIDLSADNLDKLRKALDPFTAKARRAGGQSAQRRRTPGTNLAEIREWAKANGHDVSDRGRISAEVLRAYRQAN
jgi:hypothetical protein